MMLGWLCVLYGARCTTYIHSKTHTHSTNTLGTKHKTDECVCVCYGVCVYNTVHRIYMSTTARIFYTRLPRRGWKLAVYCTRECSHHFHYIAKVCSRAQRAAAAHYNQMCVVHGECVAAQCILWYALLLCDCCCYYWYCCWVGVDGVAPRASGRKWMKYARGSAKGACQRALNINSSVLMGQCLWMRVCVCVLRSAYMWYVGMRIGWGELCYGCDKANLGCGLLRWQWKLPAILDASIINWDL